MEVHYNREERYDKDPYYAPSDPSLAVYTCINFKVVIC